MSREVAEQTLKGQPVGTFLIRFAESPPGRFDIVFVGHEMVKHYPVTEQPVFTLVAKEVILHPYLSPAKPEVLQDGYQNHS